MSKKRAILNAKMIDGLYLPFSSEPIVCLDTSSANANSSCEIPRCLRIMPWPEYLPGRGCILYGKTSNSDIWRLNFRKRN